MKRYSDKSFDPDASDLNHEAYGRGISLYKVRKFGYAARAFEIALEYWPLDPEAWFALGNCYDELKKPAKAEECFRKSLRFTAPEKQADVLFNLGNSLYDQDKLVEAIECYEMIGGQNTVYAAAQKNLMLTKNEYSNRNT